MGERYKQRLYGLSRGTVPPQRYGDYIMTGPNISREETPPERPADASYTKNCAVLPELRPPVSAQPTQEPPNQAGALKIHGYTAPEYQQVYHAVVDPFLYTAGGQQRPYSMELGHAIKQRLLEELFYPALQITKETDDRVRVTERFCVLRAAPRILVEISGEPSCEGPRKRRPCPSTPCYEL